MTSPQDPRPAASLRVWPARPADLVDTALCPACFRPLVGPLCGFCGLDLASPRAATVLELGRRIVDTEAARQALIVRMRAEAAAAAAGPRSEALVAPPVGDTSPVIPGVPVPAAPLVPPVSPVSPVSFGHPGAQTPPPSTPRGSEPRGATPIPGGLVPGPPVPRRSSAQVLLLTAGVVLVSVFAIFFAVLAYVVASVETRSVLTAAASLVVIGIAWFLRRRGLDGTAEGIAVVGVVLLLLDVWIVRVNRLFSADTLNLSLYTGLAFLVVSAVLIVVSRVTGLRAASISAAVIAPAGVFALVLGVTESIRGDSIDAGPLGDESTRVLLSALAAALVVLIERIPGVPRVEAVVLRVMSIGAGIVALLTAATAFPFVETGPALGFALAGVAWIALLLTVHRRHTSVLAPRGRAWAVIAAVGVAAAAVGLTSRLVVAAAVTIEQASGLHSAAHTVAAGLIVWAARAAAPPLSRSLRVSGAVVAGAAALSLAPVLGGILPPVAESLIGGPFRSSPLDPVVFAEPGVVWFVIGAALTSVALIGALAALGSRRVSGALTWVAVALVTVAVLGAAALAPSVLATVAIAVVGSALLLVLSAWRRAGSAARVAAFVGALVAACSVAAFSLASAGVWVLGTLVALGLLAAARLVSRRSPPPLSQLGAVATSVLAVVVLLWAGALVPSWLARISGVPDATPTGFGAAMTAVVMVGALAFCARRMVRSEVAILSGISLLVLVPAAVSVWATADLVSDVGWRIVLTALAVVAAAVWTVSSASTLIRSAGAGLGVPLLTLLVADVCLLLSAGSAWVPGALGGAALLAVLSALVLLRDRSRRSRATPTGVLRAVESSLGLTATITLVLAVVDGGPVTRVTLLVLAVVPTLLAFAAPDPAGRRRHIAWLGAALAVASLWWFLVDERVTVVEYYSLPVAGLLLAVGGIAGLAGRGSSQYRPTGDGTSPPRGLDVLIGAGLAVAALPSALVAAEGGPGRAIITAALGTIAIVVALLVLRDHREIHLRSLVWTAGVIAVALPVVIRISDTGVRLSDTDVITPEAPIGGPGLAWWLGSAALVLIGAALGASRVRRSPVLSDVAAMAAAAAIGITVSTALTRGAIARVDASPWLLIVGAIAVTAFTLEGAVLRTGGTDVEPRRLRSTRPSSRTVAVVGALSGVAIGLSSWGTSGAIEWVSVPIAVAAIAAGVVRLSRDPAVGSWPTLAPGLLILLLPSLAHDLGQSELWRVIALGVTGIAVTIVGARSRLQSALVIGATVTVLHGLAQLWPWISGLYDAGYWWVWAGVGGVLLIVFAARYEQRMQNLRAVGRALRALR